MFTGLIAETGTIDFVEERTGAMRIRVAAPLLASRLRTGDSIAVSGVCLTALAITGSHFEADLARETIARTSLSRLAAGTVVNLELPTPAGTPLGGHIVQGHVDGIGKLHSLTAVTAGTPEHTDWLLQVDAPAALARYIVEKGSITIEGISLTVAALELQPESQPGPTPDPQPARGSRITVAVIPHTYAATNLHTLHPNDAVNLEVDILAKYAEQRARLTAHKAESITEFSLIAAGY